MRNTAYGNYIEIALDFNEALEQTTKHLKDEGFGVLTEIDINETLKKKLDVDFRNYRILGACNPPLAHKALDSDENIGLLLPCNVIVDDMGGGKIRIAAIDPVAAMEIAKNEKIKPIAEEVKSKLNRVLARMEESLNKEKR